jgi:hypothetical protein
VDFSEMTDYSLRETGPLVMKGLGVNVDGEKWASCESLGWDKVLLPSYGELLLAMSSEFMEATPDPSAPTISEILQSSPTAFTNVTVKNLQILGGEEDEEKFLSLAESRVSYTMNGPAHDLTVSYDGVEIPKSLLEDSDDALPASALAVLPETLVLSGGLEAALSVSDASGISLDCKTISLALQDLCRVDMNFALEGMNSRNVLMGAIQGAPIAANLSRMELTLTDLALSDFVFAVLAGNLSQEGMQPETIREQYVAVVEAGGRSLHSKTLKELASNMALFLKKPGATFTLALHPANPLPILEIEVAAVTNPDSLGLSSAVRLQD